MGNKNFIRKEGRRGLILKMDMPYTGIKEICSKRRTHVLHHSFNHQYGGHSDHLLSFSQNDLGGWLFSSPGGGLAIRDRQYNTPAYLGLAHPSTYCINFRVFPSGGQWINALVGVSSGERISCQWFLGCGVRFDSDQHCELDTVQVFTLLRLSPIQGMVFYLLIPGSRINEIFFCILERESVFILNF